jgi:hypothetical protein
MSDAESQFQQLPDVGQHLLATVHKGPKQNDGSVETGTAL